MSEWTANRAVNGGMTAVIIASLLYLPLGLVFGGILATGQAEPLRWFSASLYLAALLAFRLRRQSRPLRWYSYGATALFTALAVLIFCGVAGQYWSLSHALILGIANLVLFAGMDVLFRVRRGSGLILATVLLAGLLLPSRAYLWLLNPPAPVVRPSLAIMTSLPIAPMRDRTIGDILQDKDGPHPAAVSLARHFQLRFIDFLSPQNLAGAKQLLLAHPRAMQPGELVALDGWVRAGGKVVILADPLLAWSGPFPLGDSRRAPVTSLLDPLFAHWGLELEPASNGSISRVMPDRHLLVTSGASRFRVNSLTCTVQAAGFVARCPLGRGTALMVADADLLNADYWMGPYGKDNPDPHRTADNMQLVLGWLGVPQSRLAPPTGWILSASAMGNGLAAASLFLLMLLFLSVRMGPSRASSGNIWENRG